MLCSGCGKDIPFIGAVCPYCQRDKSNNQQNLVLAIIFGFSLGFLGFLVFGFFGAISGLFVGIVIGFFEIDTKTAPPEVRILKQKLNHLPGNTSEVRLVKLKDLLDKGLIEETEYKQKKKDVLNKL